MTLHPKSLKVEFRVLAIDTCNSKQLIGVVYRGGQFLDGVLMFGQRAKAASQIGKGVRESKYFPELQILMLHDPSNTVDSELVRTETRLPLLTFLTKKSGHNKSSQSFQFLLGRIWINTLLDTATVQRILHLTWTTGRLPEPVRVAHLLARSIRFSAIIKVKDKSRPASQAC